MPLQKCVQEIEGKRYSNYLVVSVSNLITKIASLYYAKSSSTVVISTEAQKRGDDARGRQNNLPRPSSRSMMTSYPIAE
jgi:hypothetical protein